MKEQLYTIPVNDAFDTDCECPICIMRKTLENDAITYTLGPSYMEDDNRAKTDEQGFCSTHIKALYSQGNRLGLALILNTHIDKTLSDIKKLSKNSVISNGNIFKKKSNIPPIIEYINKLENNCFICNRIDNVFKRYLITILHLYKTDTDFVNKFKNSKGFCTKHYANLYELAISELDKKELNEFLETLNNIYFKNMERVNDDLDWFIKKFDYRFQNEPWKNSQDALPRSIIKTHNTILDNI